MQLLYIFSTWFFEEEIFTNGYNRSYMYMYINDATTEAKLTKQNALAWLDEIFLHLEEATIELWKIVMWLILDKQQL